ncbi:MAG: hypothetical protein ACLQJ0_12810 [Steroidobacteraceae bacterium]|jgi:hypothetical protein
MTPRIVVAGGIAGVLSTVTGYLITGRLFHPYQARTPNTWRSTESWSSYLVSTGLRLFAGVAIACLYAGIDFGISFVDRGTILSGASFGLGLWAMTVAPMTLEAALFVNWHRGFVVGLLLDWMVVFILAGIAGSVAARVG